MNSTAKMSMDQHRASGLTTVNSAVFTGQLSSSACFKINQNFQLWQVAAITETASVYTVFARCQACYLH